MISEQILHYVITEKLGSGGMGEVYLAQDTKLKRQVALKLLPESLRDNADARERLLREAQAASKLTHPNIVTVYAIDEHDGRDFIAMEYVDGSPLDEFVSKIQPSLSDTLGIAIGIANGLNKAHRAGVVHRDLKPGNVLLDADGRAKIVDFGLAKLEGAKKLSQTGSALGTVAYMAPEQAQGRDADHRADLFSLGAMLYEMIAGRRPFDEEHEAAIIYTIVNEEPEPLARYKSEVPGSLQQIVSKCLAKRTDERYQSAADLIADLKKAKRNIESGKPSQEDDGGLQSIAVLPFSNMSADPDNEYFGDGLAEELLNALTGIKQLRVAARTSSFAFKGKDIDIRDIGRQLNVATVLEGSVRKAGNRIRVTAQLINVADGYHLWSERYDRELADVFAIQDEISDAIVAALKVTLAGKEKRKLSARPTENIEAYNIYLQGRYSWSKRTAEDLRQSIVHFEHAIELDPNFALAHVALADSWSLLCSYHILSPANSIPQAKTAAANAMELDDSLAGAYEAKAHVRILDDWRWEDAEREYRHAIALNPSYATARQRLALLLAVTGQTDEAIEEIARAQMLEPLSLIINTDAGLLSYVRGEYDRAITHCRQVLSMNERFGVAHFVMGLALEGLGEYDQAIGALHKAKSFLGATTVVSGSLGHAYAGAGDSEEAQMILEEISELSAKRYVSPYGVALIHLALKREDEALESLRGAVDKRSVWLVHLHMAADPRLKSLHGSREFRELLPRLGLRLHS